MDTQPMWDTGAGDITFFKDNASYQQKHTVILTQRNEKNNALLRNVYI